MAAFIYKYRTIPQTVQLLQTRRIALVDPRRFNDPFDLQLELRFDFTPDELRRALASRTLRLVTQPNEPVLAEPGTLAGLVRDLRDNRQKLGDEAIAAAVHAAVEQLSYAEQLEQRNEEWRTYQERCRVFCGSDHADGLLMWAHYADEHRGAVIRFRRAAAAESVLHAAYRVTYSAVPPVLEPLVTFVSRITGEPSGPTAGATLRYLLTKSDHWAYERELRVVTQVEAGEPPVILWDLQPGEIDGVFLGCRIDAAARHEVVEAAGGPGSGIEILQMRRAPHAFQLIAEPI